MCHMGIAMNITMFLYGLVGEDMQSHLGDHMGSHLGDACHFTRDRDLRSDFQLAI
jgi:hypothetical protein